MCEVVISTKAAIKAPGPERSMWQCEEWGGHSKQKA